MNSKAKKTALFGLMIALAFVFSYLETLIPLNIGVAGVKLGLANLVVVTALYTMPRRDAFFIAIIRIILVGITFAGVSTLIYSLAGGLLSFAVMCLLQKSKRFSVIGVSLAGGIAHNLGQILAASLVMQIPRIIYYLPVLAISGVVTGILIGIISRIIIERLNKMKG